MDDKCADALERIGRTSLEMLVPVLRGVTLDYGYRYFGLLTLPSKGMPIASATVAGTWPREWLSYHTRQGYEAVDPVMAQARQTILPVEWSQQIPAQAPERLATLTNDARQFGIATGIALPVFCSDGRRGVFCFAGERAALSESERTALHLIALLANSRMLLPRSGVTTKVPSLTGRQMQILQWISTGKTNQEIGEVLGISSRTVEAHVANISARMGTKNSVHTVALAAAHGLITLPTS